MKKVFANMNTLGPIFLAILSTFFIQQALCYDDIYKLQRGKLQATIPEWGKEWRVSLEIKPLGKIRQWGSIIHFSQGGNCCKVGQRVPAIWFNPGNNRLHITFGLNNVGNYYYNAPKDLPRNKFTRVVMDQIEVKPNVYRYRIFINGQTVRSVQNKIPRVFKNVKVYAADPWNYPANAIIRDFKFTVEPEFRGPLYSPVVGNLKKGKVLTTIPTWGKEWIVSFQIKPVSKQRGWTNILRFFAHGKYKKLGDRIPSVWLYPNSLRLSVYSQLGNNYKYGYTTPRNLPTTKFTQVTIAQRHVSRGKIFYTITINGKVVFNRHQTRPIDYRNVKVYASDPWYYPSKAFIQNLTFQPICSKYSFFTQKQY